MSSGPVEATAAWLMEVWPTPPEGLAGRLGESSEEVLALLEAALEEPTSPPGVDAEALCAALVFRVLDLRGESFPTRLDPFLVPAALYCEGGIVRSSSGMEALRRAIVRVRALPGGRGVVVSMSLAALLTQAEAQARAHDVASRMVAAGDGLDVVERSLAVKLKRAWADRHGWHILSGSAAELERLPLERRAAVLVAAGAPWPLIRLAPTPAVLRAAFESLDRRADFQMMLFEALRTIGRSGLPTVLEALTRESPAAQHGLGRLIVELASEEDLPALLDVVPLARHAEARGAVVRRVALQPSSVTHEAVVRRWQSADPSGRRGLAEVVAFQAARGEDVGAVLEALRGLSTPEDTAAVALETLEQAAANMAASAEERFGAARAWLVTPEAPPGEPWLRALSAPTDSFEPWSPIKQTGRMPPGVMPWGAACALAGAWGTTRWRQERLAWLERFFGRAGLVYAARGVLRLGELPTRLAPLYVWLVEVGGADLDLHARALRSGVTSASEVAVRALPSCGEGAIEVALEALGASLAAVRVAGARALGAIKAPATGEALRLALAKERSKAVQEALRLALRALEGASGDAPPAAGLFAGPEDYDLQRALEGLRGVFGEEATLGSWLWMCDLFQRMLDHGDGGVGLEYVMSHGADHWTKDQTIFPTLWAALPAASQLRAVYGDLAAREGVCVGVVSQLHSAELREALLKAVDAVQRRTSTRRLGLEQLELFTRAVYFGWRWCAAHDVPVGALRVRVDGGAGHRRSRDRGTRYIELREGFGFEMGNGPIVREDSDHDTPAGLRALGVHLAADHPLSLETARRGRWMELRDAFMSV